MSAYVGSSKDLKDLKDMVRGVKAGMARIKPQGVCLRFNACNNTGHSVRGWISVNMFLLCPLARLTGVAPPPCSEDHHTGVPRST